jgi:hypothetical protein
MKSCMFTALVLCICALPVAAQSGLVPSQPASEAIPSTSTITPPEHPISKEQLQQWMEEAAQLDTMREQMQTSLDKMRDRVPSWVPDSVWADFKSNFAHIDFAAVLLPAYQRYFSDQDGAAMLLMLQGPTGQEYARLTHQIRLDAMRQGLSPSAAEAKAMQDDKAEELRHKRFAELTPVECSWSAPLTSTRGLWRGMRGRL